MDEPQTAKAAKKKRAKIRKACSNKIAFRIGYSNVKRHWSANLHRTGHSSSDNQIAGFGHSPRAAFLAAVKNPETKLCA